MFLGQITDPAVVLVRLMAGAGVRDAMAPASYDDIRFVLLAAINGPAPTIVEELDSTGEVVAQAAAIPLP